MMTMNIRPAIRGLFSIPLAILLSLAACSDLPTGVDLPNEETPIVGGDSTGIPNNAYAVLTEYAGVPVPGVWTSEPLSRCYSDKPCTVTITARSGYMTQGKDEWGNDLLEVHVDVTVQSEYRNGEISESDLVPPEFVAYLEVEALEGVTFAGHPVISQLFIPSGDGFIGGIALAGDELWVLPSIDWPISLLLPDGLDRYQDPALRFRLLK
jgi:hypothetical protein